MHYFPDIFKIVIKELCMAKESKICPLCSRVVNISNASFNKLEGRRLCSNCSMRLNAVYPTRFSFKGISIEEAKKAMREYAKPKEYEPKTTSYTQQAVVQEKNTTKIPKKACCPKCHSQNIVPVGHKHKNFATGRAVVGSTLLNPVVGIGVGLLGKTEHKMEFYCSDCGHQFKR